MAARKTGIRRRGATIIQWCFVAVAVVVVVLISVGSLGTTTDAELNRTAIEVGDPTQLPERFGN